MTTPEHLGTTPVSRVTVEACRIAYDQDDPAHGLPLDQAAAVLIERLNLPDIELSVEQAQEVLTAVGDRSAVNFGSDFSGQTYRARAMLRLLVSVEVDVPAYLLAHPHHESTRRHALDDLEPQARREMCDQLATLDWVRRTHYVTPTAQLIWKG